jgi:MFS family permease
MSTITATPAVLAPATVIPRSTRKWLAFGVLALAQFLVVLGASMVNIALPVIGGRLHMDTPSLAGVITAYVLAFGGLLLLGGVLTSALGWQSAFLVNVLVGLEVVPG